MSKMNHTHLPKQRLSSSLKELRAKEGWSQSGTAKALKINRSTYASYEEGRAFPMLHMLARMAKVFKVTVDCLMKRETTIQKHGSNSKTA